MKDTSMPKAINRKILAWFNADKEIYLLVLASFVVRIVFVFLLTDYPHYLVSDMGGYWGRAIDRYHGDVFSVSQWAFHAPLYHIILSTMFKVFAFLGAPFAYLLELTLLTNCILASVTVFFVYRISLSILEIKKWALSVAALYSLTYPLIYINAFVLSENLAIPLLVAANYFIFRQPRNYLCLALCGLLLCIAAGMRPIFGPLVFSFASFIFLANQDQRKIFAAAKTALFIVIFFLGILSICAYNAHISKGAVKGLGPNGGFTFFAIKAKVGKIIFKFGDHSYWVEPCQYLDGHKPAIPLLEINHAIYDQTYFYSKGMECVRNNPKILWDSLLELRCFLVGYFFPHFADAKGFKLLLPLFTWIIGIMTIVAFFFFWIIFLIQKWYDKSKLLFLWSLLLFTAMMGYVISAERRFLLPLIYVVYIICFCLAKTLVDSTARSELRADAKAWLITIRKRLFIASVSLLPIAALTFFAMHQARAHGAQPSLLGLFKCDGDAKDSSPNMHHGTVHGAKTCNGMHGDALEFNGLSDYVDLGPGFDNFRRGLTIAFWTCPNAVKKYARFFDFGNGEAQDNILLTRLNRTNDLAFAIFVGKNTLCWLTCPNVLDSQMWQHFAITIDPLGNCTLYKNAYPMMRAKSGLPKNILRTNNYIGRSNWPTDEFFAGKMDEIYVFNGCLSGGQIRRLMENRP